MSSKTTAALYVVPMAAVIVVIDVLEVYRTARPILP